MKTSARGIKLLTDFEGFRGEAYRDIVGVLTIGYGFTDGVKLGDKMSRAQADYRLQNDLHNYELAVEQAAGRCTQNQFDALVCFAWNVGIAGMRGSSVIKAHRRGDYEAAARAFGLWNKAGGKVVSGLVRRRSAEAALYLEPMPDDVSDGAAPDMPQAVDAERPMTASNIVKAGGATAAVSALSVAGQVAQQIHDIKVALGDWLPYAILGLAVAGIGFGLWTVYERWKQRTEGRA